MNPRPRAAVFLDRDGVLTMASMVDGVPPPGLYGMLLEAAEAFGIDLARSVMVGDRWRDIEAGRGAGCTTIFIDNGYDEAPRTAQISPLAA